MSRPPPAPPGETTRSGVPAQPDKGLLAPLLGDGCLLIFLSGFCLALAGLFAVLQSASGHFLPHDVAALGLDARQLAVRAGPRLVAFMFHDRVAFGGALMTMGVLYAWMAGFPLARGERWAWSALLLSGLTGFASFLAYLGHGYFDGWHGAATLLLLPVFAVGLWRARTLVDAGPPAASPLWRASFRPARPAERLGRRLLLVYGWGLVLGGLTILGVGVTVVFVPEDIAFTGLCGDDVRGISAALHGVIAHDRAGFGGGLLSAGALVVPMTLHGAGNRAWWQATGLAGALGFGCAIGVHYVIGYTNWFHLLPAWLGAGVFALGWILARPGRAARL